MTTNTQNAPEEPTWGAEPPAPSSGPTWSTKKTIAAVAIAVGIAAAGGTAIYAASGTAASQAGGGPRGLYGMGGGRIQMGGFGTATHGEFQIGEVTDVSASSISVKSTDGYTKTYTIDAKTVIGASGPDQQSADISSIANGDTVTVVAESGSTASTISERPAGMTQGRDGRQPPGQQGTPPTK